MAAVLEMPMQRIAQEGSKVKSLGEERILLDGISWNTYEQLINDYRGSVRFTFDRGRLELVSPSLDHETFKRLINMAILVLSLELRRRSVGGSSTTFRRADLERGLEPDECFWIANVDRILGKKKIDLAFDPPPDLAIEISLTNELLDKWSIYALLGVPEIWLYDGTVLSFHRRALDGGYEAIEHSMSFPELQPAMLVPFLEMTDLSDGEWFLEFQSWVRESLV